MVPVSVITGFLGSGKTTLIGRLLRDPSLADTAVIVNEFGEIGLDHHLIASSDETLIQLTTGCLCCAVRTDLVDTLLDLDARRRRGEIGFARVLIETSGIADPAPILHALMTDAALAEAFTLGSVITLVDAELGEATLAAHPEARRQVALADRLVLTKTDRAAASAALLATLAALNPAIAPQSGPASWHGVDPASLWHTATRPPPAAQAPYAVHTSGIASTVVLRTEPVPALALTLLIQALAEHCGARLLRLKGLVDIAELPGQPALIHGVQHVFAAPVWLDAWPSSDRHTRIVLIGQGIPRHFAARLLDAIVDEVQDETRRRKPSGNNPTAPAPRGP